MSKKHLILLSIILTVTCVIKCGDSIVVEKTTENWLVAPDELYKRGNITEFIFPIDFPLMEPGFRATYIGQNDKVIGMEVNSQYRAYPYYLMSRHEVVNDIADEREFSVIYCPFTSMGTIWSRNIAGDSTMYGAADLIFNNGHIIFDQLTDSYWLPMKQQSIYGTQIGQPAPRLRSVETSWNTWLEMFPNTYVMSQRTGFDYDYSEDPYPQLNADHDLLFFPISRIDNRLNNKERVHVIINMNSARVYNLDLFPDSVFTINDLYNGSPVIIAGTGGKQLYVSFSRYLVDGTILMFEPLQDQLPDLMVDNEGNTWNIFGKAVSGPRTGIYLDMLVSYNCYWYTLAAMFQDIELVEL